MLWAQNRAEPRAQAVLKKMAEPGAILHLPARSSTRYCGKCGNKYEVGKQKLNEKSSSLADTNAKQVEKENRSKVPVASSSAKMQTTVSFEAYKARKESNRRTFFKPSKKSKQGKDVNIRIGLFQFDPDQNVLKPQWGKNLPLLVDRNSTYSAIHEKALAKRKAHDRHFSKISENENYQLLYPDGSEARFLPGQGKTFFDFQAYKEDLGVPYSRVALYLCSTSDIAKYEESCKLERKVLNKEEKPSDSILVNSDWLDDEFLKINLWKNTTSMEKSHEDLIKSVKSVKGMENVKRRKMLNAQPVILNILKRTLRCMQICVLRMPIGEHFLTLLKICLVMYFLKNP